MKTTEKDKDWKKNRQINVSPIVRIARPTACMRWLQPLVDFGSTPVRRLMKGHSGHNGVTRWPQSRRVYLLCPRPGGIKR